MENVENKKMGLIVTGVARSGTTALGELLNSHAEICLGVERFKFQFLREHNFSADLFVRKRFFDFREEDTNLIPALRPVWKPAYERAAEKWDEAHIVGDKVPDMLPVLGAFITENPDYRYICILRNLKDVGLSWQARADRPRDTWPSNKGFAKACVSWAEQHAVLHTLMRDHGMREQVLLLDYDRMYENVSQTEAAVLAFLGIGRDPAFSEMLESHAEFTRNRVTRRVPNLFVDAYKAVTQSSMKNLRKMAHEQAQVWAERFSNGGV